MVFANVDVADVFAVEAGFVGDGADDVAGEYAMDVAYLETEGFHFDGVVAASVAFIARATLAVSR